MAAPSPPAGNRSTAGACCTCGERPTPPTRADSGASANLPFRPAFLPCSRRRTLLSQGPLHDQDDGAVDHPGQVVQRVLDVFPRAQADMALSPSLCILLDSTRLTASAQCST